MPSCHSAFRLAPRFFKLLKLISLSLFLTACATQPPPKSASIDALSSEDGEIKVLLMPLDVELSELTAGGSLEPKAEWTESAKQFMTEAFAQYQAQRDAELIVFDDRKQVTFEVAELETLHSVVGNSIFLHHYYPMHKLPSKQNNLDWSLGPSVSQLSQQYDADYALFVFVRDSYSSPGRVAVMIVGAALGVGIGGGFQVGFASLVDLKNGEVVWFNRLINAAGDLRTAEAATKTVENLLVGMPQ